MPWMSWRRLSPGIGTGRCWGPGPCQPFHKFGSGCAVILMHYEESFYMSYSLNSLKGGYMGDHFGDCYRGY